MSRTQRDRRRGLRWRWLFDSPLVVATWVTVLLGAWSMQQVGDALRSSAVVSQQAERELARLAADAAVLQAPMTSGDGVWCRPVGEIDVTVRRRGDELVIVTTMPEGKVLGFTTRVLPGAGPEVLGQASSPTVPRLDSSALSTAARADSLPAFRRDDGVALLHFDGGTDLDDFVLEQNSDAIDALTTGVVLVPGHLWIEPGRAPLVVRCERDTTVVVRGNLYIGRSLEVEGPGRVLFVTVGSDHAVPFADRDGNGRRGSAESPAGGALEGGGNVYFGLTPASSPTLLNLRTGFVVDGYVHLLRNTQIDGPFAVGRPIVTIGPGAELTPTGLRLFHPEREIVPGFPVAGPSRPGLLSALAAGPESPDEQALYLTESAR